MFETLRWIGDADGYLEIVDQRKLPLSFEKLSCRTVEQLYDAIKTLAVRGAPAIGVAAGFGCVLAVGKGRGLTKNIDLLDRLRRARDFLGSSRPTAVNLFWATQQIEQKAADFVRDNPDASVEDVVGVIFEQAKHICEQDKQMCRRIGLNGQRFIRDGFSILTHCNAGALATAGEGTALAVIYEAQRRRMKIRIYVDETRPLLQGARLTMWELAQARIETTLICDNMAAALMKRGVVDAVIVGADRIAANGDTANKTGTYGLSILAKHHGVPFYVAAPSSTFDLSIKTGADIPIEQRSGLEVTTFGTSTIAPPGVDVYNPAFDVADAADITAIITEKDVIEKPDTKKIAACLG